MFSQLGKHAIFPWGRVSQEKKRNSYIHTNNKHLLLQMRLGSGLAYHKSKSSHAHVSLTAQSESTVLASGFSLVNQSRLQAMNLPFGGRSKGPLHGVTFREATKTYRFDFHQQVGKVTHGHLTASGQSSTSSLQVGTSHSPRTRGPAGPAGSIRRLVGRPSRLGGVALAVPATCRELRSLGA